MTTFLHNGPLGDIIYSLPVIKHLGGGILYIGKGEFRDFSQYPGLIYQISNLLKSQHYIDEVLTYTGEKVDYDLNHFRWEAGRYPEKNLVQCHFDALNIPVIFDTKEAWFGMYPPKNYNFSIVVSQTTRFHDCDFNFEALRPYQSTILFLGFPSEYEMFVQQTGLSGIRYLDNTGKGDDLFLEFSRVIKASALYVGNQSFLTALANSMQVNRAIKVFKAQPNCNFYAPNFYTELTRDVVECCLNGY